jgi:hypothetical protein
MPLRSQPLLGREASKILHAPIPGTHLNVATLGIDALLVFGAIWGLRKLYQKVFE